MNDLKKYLLLDDKKLSNSLKDMDKLGKLSFISNDIDYWKDKFIYKEERSALQNFLLYRTAGAFDLFERGKDDADITFPALNELKKKICSLPCVEKVEVGKDINKYEKDRAFLVYLKDGRNIYLESDTANSLMRDLGDFLRIMIPKIEKIPKESKWADATYIRQYKLDERGEYYYSPFKYYYFYTLISKLDELLQDKIEIECLAQLEKRAQFTHVLKNMILVPYGYNSNRGFKLNTYKSNRNIQDRLDLTVIDFEEMLEDVAFGDVELQARLGNSKCTVDSVKFLVENKDLLFPTIPIFTKEVHRRDILDILERTKIINKTLSVD